MDQVNFKTLSINYILGIILLFWDCGGSAEKVNSFYLNNRNYSLETHKHELYKMKYADIVMLGNSITYGVNWTELLNRYNIANRGISGDITEGYLNRMDNVLSLKPKVCFIMGGINDLYSGIKPEAVFENYKMIIELLLNNNITPIVQSTLFVSPQWRIHEKKNREVKFLNSLLRKYTTEKEIIFLDLNKFLSPNGILMDKFTYDGLHLNAAAYNLWGNEVEKILTDLNF